MPGLSHLKDVLDKQGKAFIENLLNKSVIINEKMDGAFFGVKLDPNSSKFQYFKRNGELSYIDRVLSRYFEPAVQYFESLSPETIEKIPVQYMFGMEYFADKKAQVIAYDRLPKNKLILSYIHILNAGGNISETVQSRDELNKWADLLGIERPPIIFQGKLTDEQKKKIQEFVYTPFDELVEKFKTVSFTKYIMSVLNPKMEATFLRDSLDKDIEGIVFRFYEEGKKTEDPVFLAKLVDPAFQANAKARASDKNQKKSDDYIWIIVIDLMNFIEQYSLSELRGIKVAGETYEEKYISLVNHIYLEFIKEFGEKYRDLDIQIPEFLQRDDFNVNFGLVNDARVTQIIESNPNFKEIYRVFLNMFRKKKIRVSSSFFTKEMKDNLNTQVDKISKVIMGDAIYENYFPTFKEFVGEDKEPGYFESFKGIEDRRTKPVNLIISDFQPIHPGHIKSAQGLFNENGLPCLLVCVHCGATSKAKPFKKETIVNALHKLVNLYPSFMVGLVIVPDGEVESLLKEIRPEYEPNIVAANKSRIRDIALQLELARKRSRNLNLKKDLRLMELPTAGVKESIMDAVRNNDYTAFKSAAPNAIHSEFFNMNRDLSEKLNESKTVDLSQFKSPGVPVIEIDDTVDLILEEKKQEYYQDGMPVQLSPGTSGSSGTSGTSALPIMESVNPYCGFYKIDADKLQDIADALTEKQIEYTVDPVNNFITIECLVGHEESEIVKKFGGVAEYLAEDKNGVLIRGKGKANVPPGAMM